VNERPTPSEVRFARTAAILGRTTFALAVAGAVAAFVPGSASRALAWGVIASVVAIPLVRVVILIAVWLREGDRRYAALAAALLAIIATGAAIALLR